MDALRDWGHAKDYVEMQWLMLQQEKPDDFVIATGKQYSVRQFIKWTAAELGIELEFEGSGLDESAKVVGVPSEFSDNIKVGDVIVKVDKRYFRPAEVETLLGDPTKAREALGWTPTITAEEMCSEMVKEDLQIASQTALLKKHGYSMPIAREN